jgi:hypothetical protein
MTMVRERGVVCRGIDLIPPVTFGGIACVGGIDEEGIDFAADAVICREVFEHLTIRTLPTAVINLCRLSTRYVYVTARFADHPAHLLDVQTADSLDPTHISLLPRPLLRLLFTFNGMTRCADLETRLDWQHQGRVLVYEHVSRTR